LPPPPPPPAEKAVLRIQDFLFFCLNYLFFYSRTDSSSHWYA
jgi:hypothetical protein